MKKAGSRWELWFWFFVALLGASLVIAGLLKDNASAASPPSIITYQGKLLEGGVAVSTTKQMSFLLYSASTGGTVLYTASGTTGAPTSTQMSITPSSGIFSVDLGAGSTNAIDADIFQNNDSVYLEVWIGSQALSPRKRLTSAPYAVNSRYLDGVAATTTSSGLYIPKSDSNGNFTFTGTPQSSGVSGGVIYINPSSADADETIFGVAVGGNARLRVDEDGDTTVGGNLTVSSTLYTDVANGRVGINSSSPQYALSVDGMSYITGTSTFAGTSTFNDFTHVVGKNSSPVFLSSETSASALDSVSDIVVVGDLLYATSYDDDLLSIYDVSYPEQLVLVSSYQPGGLDGNLNGALRLFVSGKYAYVSAYLNDSVEIIDISNPADPQRVSTYRPGGANGDLDGPYAVFVSGKYAYVAASENDSLDIVDVSDPANPVQVKSYQPGGANGNLDAAQDVFVSGRYAYVVSNANDSMLIIDVGEPANPTTVATYQPGGLNGDLNGASEVVISGKYAYIAASGNDSLDIVDVSDPANPVQTKSYQPGGANGSLNDISDIFISGDYAYVAALGAGTVVVVDIASSTDPAIVGSIALTSPEQIFVQDNYLYTAHPLINTVAITDISGARIANVVVGSGRIGNIHVDNIGYFEQDIVIRGGATIGSGLLLSGDLGLSRATTTLSATNTISFSHTAFFQSSASSSETLAFLFDTRNSLGNTADLLSIRNNGTSRLTLTGQGYLGINSSSPQFTLGVDGTFGVTGTSTLATTTVSGDFTVDSGMLYVDAANNRVGINSSSPQSGFVVHTTSTFASPVDINGRALDPVLAASIDDVDGTDQVFDVFARGDYAYTANFSGGLRIYDISNPASPTTTDAIDDGGNAYKVHVAGEYAYLANDTDGLRIYDISNPYDIISVGHVDVGSAGFHAVHVAGNYAYVGGHSDGVRIFDVSDPYNPINLSNIDDGGFAVDVQVIGKYLYVANSTDGLRIYDISDPRNPVNVGARDDGTILNLEVSGKYLYAGHVDPDQLRIYDISNPAAPTTTGFVTLAADARGLHISGNYAYVASLSVVDGSVIVDISDPTAPTVVKKIAALTKALTMHVQGNYLYVANGTDGLFIYDITGSKVVTTDIGTAKIRHAQFFNDTIFDQNVNVRGGAVIGGSGLLLSGDIGFSAPTTSLSATNTIRFSHSALFRSSASSSETNLFIFDTVNAFTTANSSTYLLSVRNNGTPAFSVASNGDVAASGTLYAASATVGTPGNPGDLAERVDVRVGELIEAGDVLVVDPLATDRYMRSKGAYEQNVAGVVSTLPTIVLGNGRTENTAVMALAGRVPVKASAQNGGIARGDLLVTASTSGHAMRYDPLTTSAVNAGIVGIALEPLATGTGKIMTLLKSGWVGSEQKTVTEMQQEVLAQHADGGAGLLHDPTQLNVQTNSAGQLVIRNNNVNFLGSILLNVAGIMSASNRWEIDDKGRFITRVLTADGEKPFYAVQAERTTMVFSGSGQLQDGHAEVLFATTTREVIDENEPMTVTVTLTEEANGMYVSGKSARGFTVRELNGGAGSATFDWQVSAVRKQNVTGAEEAAKESAQERDPAIVSGANDNGILDPFEGGTGETDANAVENAEDDGGAEEAADSAATTTSEGDFIDHEQSPSPDTMPEAEDAPAAPDEVGTPAAPEANIVEEIPAEEPVLPSENATSS